MNEAIQFDFRTGKITNAGIVERIGLGFMRLGASILSTWEFTGFSYVAKLMSTIFPSKRMVRITFDEDCLFEFPYGDGYWGRMIYNKFVYGPDVEPYLESMADVDYLFIDCGSNFGYMSAMVTSSGYGSKKSIAIEADPQNYKFTKRNSEINGDRYEYRHNAIFSKSGEMVSLFGAKHEARSIINDGGDEVVSGAIETLALDDLLDWMKINGNKPVVLKLDVEGVEIDALKGAKKLLELDCMIIYEDHGNEKDHDTSRYIKDELDLRIFLGREDRMEMSEMQTWSDFDAMKVNSRRGYDLFATKSPFWIKQLNRFTKVDLEAK